MRKYIFYAFLIGVLGWGGMLALQELRLRTLSFSPDFTMSSEPAQTDWSFILLPDLHNAEGYLQNKAAKRMTSPEDRQAMIARHAALYASFAQRFETDTMIVPGDLMDGEWFTPDLETRFRPELSYKDRVRAAAKIVYSSFLKAAEQAGFETILVVPGDHEYGDDPWAPLSRRDSSFPVFRALFAAYFGTPVQEKFMDSGGYSTPVGTVFENTSYAVRIKNSVVISVDMFVHTKNRIAQAAHALRGELQTVTGTVEGAHLRWLESVLAAAREDPSIEHVFVQGHLPVLHPVRARGSSVMYLDGGAESPFWKLLQKYNVDVYFAGEVHSDTLIKDAETPLIQVSTRAGIERSMVTAVQVKAGGLTITQYGQNPDGTLMETGRYRRDTNNEESFSGVLTPLDTEGPVLHYAFDAPDRDQITNRGSFGAYYNLTCAGCDITRDEQFGGALAGGTAHTTDKYVSPAFLRSMPTTISFRFRSTDQGRGVIFSAADGGLRKGFAVFLDNGVLELKHFHRYARLDVEGSLADGEWHHVTFRHARDEKLFDLKITVDGNTYRLVEWPTQETPTWRDLVLTWQRGLDSPPNHALSLGGHFSPGDAPPVLPFKGSVTDFRLWGRVLTDREVEGL